MMGRMMGMDPEGAMVTTTMAMTVVVAAAVDVEAMMMSWQEQEA